MFVRLRRTLVESFVGAIALGYLLAEGIMHFVNVFAAPIAGWIARNEYRGSLAGAALPSRSSLQYALPEFVRSLFMFAIFYVLLRWLYFKPLKMEISEPVRETGDAV
jgi:ABC-type dipeptide/oligopeptide/nickel transport system permease component